MPAAMTYDLARLGGHGLIAREAHSHRYRVSAEGVATAAVITTLHDRVLASALARASPGAAPPHPRWARYDRALLELCRDAQLAAEH